jgi:hypothetical protein
LYDSLFQNLAIISNRGDNTDREICVEPIEAVVMKNTVLFSRTTRDLIIGLVVLTLAILIGLVLIVPAAVWSCVNAGRDNVTAGQRSSLTCIKFALEVVMNSQIRPTGKPQLRPGYTIDPEGRLNVYAIEPEMYINHPGDLRSQQEAEKEQRLHELEELQEDETGKLTAEHDFRHKGPGLV